MIEIKQGVGVTVLHPAIIHALNVVSKEWAGVTDTRPVVTSLQDGKHSATSLHYGTVGDIRCRAFDLRTWESSISEDDLDTFVQRLTMRLGPEYDVVLESNHLHVEYDPT